VLRVGADVVEVSEVAGSVSRFGDRYLSRLFTQAETGLWPSEPAALARGLAQCFAAKEATMKLLKSAAVGLDWRSIEVKRDLQGRLGCCLTGKAAELAQRAGITRISLSLSCAGPLAMAIVVAELAAG
jgi:holo-[acyl-carrier protein] synthase